MALPDDLILYASASMPEDDSTTSGGAIDLDNRLELTQLSTSSALELVSSAAGDTTQSVTVEARDEDELVVSETVTLTGTTAVDLSTLGTVARVLQVTMNSDAAGTVTLREDGAGDTVGTIPPGERGFCLIHREAEASASSTEDFYYKGFIRNTGAQTLTAGTVVETNDVAGRVTIALAATLDDSGSVTNRKTSPGLTFSAGPHSLPDDLGPNEAIGVWFLFSHPAGEGDLLTTTGITIAGVAA